LQSLQPLYARIGSSLLLYLILFLSSLCLLALFCWYFTGRLLQPLLASQESQNRFIASVSHELRTPLTNIRSYAETMDDGVGDLPPEMEKRFLGVILNESDRMAHILQDLLTLSLFDSGRSELRLTRFPFAQVVDDTYQAILMDIRMPVMNGYDATVAIRELDRSDNGLPIIAMTADAFSEDVQRCLECGMNDHLAKPIDVEVLLATLNKILS